jgi:hypothetical protein
MNNTNTEKTLKDVVTGEVVSVEDPTYSGRIKVKIPGINENVEVEKLPWCTYGGSAFFSGDGGGSISIPRVGTKVRVRFKKGDANSMEWYATNRIDRAMAEELAQDYEGSHAILYDSASDLSILYTNTTGLRLYYKKSFIQISPDNNITIHYGNESSGVQIQLSDGKIDIQAPQQINITSDSTVNIEANSVVVKGKNNVQIKGDTPGEVAVNGKALYRLLMTMAAQCDLKIPSSHTISDTVTATYQALLN